MARQRLRRLFGGFMILAAASVVVSVCLRKDGPDESGAFQADLADRDRLVDVVRRSTSRPIVSLPTSLPAIRRFEGTRSEERSETAPSSVSVKVVDEGGNPLGGTVIVAGGRAIAACDARGLVSVPSSPDAYFAVATGFKPRAFSASTDSIAESPHVVVLLRGARIRGRVVDQDGEPMEGAVVRAVSGRVTVEDGSPAVEGVVLASLHRGTETTTSVRESISDEHGFFELTGLDERRLQVMASKFGYVLEAEGTSVVCTPPNDDVLLTLRQLVVSVVIVRSRCMHGGHHERVHCRIAGGAPADLMQSVGSTAMVVPPAWRRAFESRMSTLPGHAVFDWGILKKRARPNDGCVEVRGQASSPLGDLTGVAMRFVPLQRFGEADCTTIDLFEACPGHGVIEVTGKGKFSAKLMSGTSPSNRLSPQSIDGDRQRFDLPAGTIRLFDSSPLLSDRRGTTVELPVGGLLRLNAESWNEGTGIVNIEVYDDAGRPSDQFLLKVGRGRREETNFIGSLYGSKVRIPAEPGDYSVVLLDGAATVIARRRLIVRPGEESRLVLP